MYICPSQSPSSSLSTERREPSCPLQPRLRRGLQNADQRYSSHWLFLGKYPISIKMLFLWMCIGLLCVSRLCPALSHPRDYSPPGSFVDEILQTKVLEWVSFPSPGDLADPGIELAPLMSPSLAGVLVATSEGFIVVILKWIKVIN